MMRQITRGTSSYSKLELFELQPEAGTGKPPVLFVHGAGHAAWCWENWMEAAADAGHAAYAVSLSGHGGSPGVLLRSSLGTYVDDVIRTAASLPSQPVIVGHSLGGLVVQKAIARYPAKGAVLVAPIPARPGIGTLASITRRHPEDTARIMVGRSLPMRAEYLFNRLDPETASAYAARCGSESSVAQFQVLLHLPAGPPKGGAPVLVLGTPNDALVPIADVRDTAKRMDAELIEFPGIGHDMMLDGGWEEPAGAMLDWIDAAVDSA
jgi:pimeloyl-ACP methyl ester carboxylesterase